MPPNPKPLPLPSLSKWNMTQYVRNIAVWVSPYMVVCKRRLVVRITQHQMFPGFASSNLSPTPFLMEQTLK